MTEFSHAAPEEVGLSAAWLGLGDPGERFLPELAGRGGLASTALDYPRFAQMLRGGGVLVAVFMVQVPGEQRRAWRPVVNALVYGALVD